jgi:hypothetical protein
VIRKPNYQNDRIWAKSIEDISADERYRNMVRDATCIGIFVMFTAKKLLCVLKEQGQSLDGVYFREIILQEHVIPFLRDPINVLDTNEFVFLHDKVPCMKADATQHLLEIGAIIKDKVEELMASEDRQNRYSYDVNTLKDLEEGHTNF